MNAVPLLKAENLSVDIVRGRKIFRAVDQISFDIFPGEICGIVGESGCGKSLTALSLANLLPPAAMASGSVFFGNESGAEKHEFPNQNLLTLNEEELCSVRGREISMIFQEPLSSLNPLMKNGRQITEVPEIHNSGADKKQLRETAIELLKKLGLENPGQIMETYPFRLSGGMCQRVMIALAMICGPRLLIADEPTTALDIDTQEQILKLLKEINSESGTSILFISHDLGVIKKICGRVMVMYAGKIIEEGDTAEVFANPAHEYTKALLGSLPERNVKGEKLKTIPGRVPSIEEGRTAGCPFAPRCEAVSRGAITAEICEKEFPAEISINENHRTRCVLRGIL